MKIQEYLEQVEVLDRLVQKKVNRADMLRKSLYGRGLTMKFDTVAVSSCTSGDSLSHAVATVVDAENEADLLIDRLCDFRVIISRLIDAVPNENQRMVLKQSYLMFRTDIQIAEELGYCRQYVHRLLTAGLENLEKEVTECDIITLDKLIKV